MRQMMLPCRLTETELTELRDRCAALVYDVGQMENERKNTAAKLKAQLDRLNEDLRELSRDIRTRSQMRQVEVLSRIDHVSGVEETIRTDTGEVVETRKLSPDERQGALPLDE